MGGMVIVIPPAGAPSEMDGMGVEVPFVDADAVTDADPEAETEADVELFPVCCLRCRSR
jgi:hypothetical protein